MTLWISLPEEVDKRQLAVVDLPPNHSGPGWRKKAGLTMPAHVRAKRERVRRKVGAA